MVVVIEGNRRGVVLKLPLLPTGKMRDCLLILPRFAHSRGGDVTVRHSVHSYHIFGALTLISCGDRKMTKACVHSISSFSAGYWWPTTCRIKVYGTMVSAHSPTPRVFKVWGWRSRQTGKQNHQVVGVTPGAMLQGAERQRGWGPDRKLPGQAELNPTCS